MPEPRGSIKRGAHRGEIDNEETSACCHCAESAESFSEQVDQESNAKIPSQRFVCQLELDRSYALGVRLPPPPSGDRRLIQIVDAALADVARRSGGRLVCRKGCTPCCIGVFAINQLDAARLQQGLAELEVRDPARAAAVRARALKSVEKLSPTFPGDPVTGLLADPEGPRFADFANDELCPALDPDEGTCDLYEFRPMTCRVFGPPVRVESGLGVCELCYQGVSDEELPKYEMVPDPEGLESPLLKKVQEKTGRDEDTIIAFCLAS